MASSLSGQEQYQSKKRYMKNIYLEPSWKQPISAQSLIQYPPQGYQFITSETPIDKAVRLAASMGFAYTWQRRLEKVAPLWLAKSYLGKFNRPPKEASLTYSIIHIVFRQEPWVLDMQCEPPFMLVGDERHFDRYKGVVEKALASVYCRKIIYPIEAGRKALLAAIGGERLEAKIEVVPWAVPERKFVKSFNESKTRLLFVNSGNIGETWHFEKKGGKEILEAFLELSRKHNNLELVIRSALSPEVKYKCRHIENIKLIDTPIPWGELEKEWMSADIFVLPAPTTPLVVFLDAMSYELPIITTDVWANREMVEDGRTGFLVPKSEVAQYIDEFGIHLYSREFKEVVRTIDPKMVAALVDKISILIENKELRRKMGKTARWEVEHGRFSINNRNEKLKRIFDEATA